jgi:hypothetical protein
MRVNASKSKFFAGVRVNASKSKFFAVKIEV